MILAVLQARMSSSRLPGKVLRLVHGRPMVGLQIGRLRRAGLIGRLVLATSREPSDDPIAEFCAAEGVPCHRGSLHDVLGRYAGAVDEYGPARHVVRLTADCPLIDPAVVDGAIAHHVASGADYTSNSMPGFRTFPDGLDCEVMTAAALDRCVREATATDEREHVTAYIYRHPEVFTLSAYTQARDLGDLRWTVDTPADFQFVQAVFGELIPVKPDFGQDDVLELLARRPDIAAINASV